MSVEIWIAYTIAATLILVIPGPTIILVVGQALSHGRSSVIPLVAGVVCGDLTCMTLSLIGLSAVLSTSAVMFSILKWIGAGYLFYLGVKMWKNSDKPIEQQSDKVTVSGFQLFKRSYIVTALNPKGIAFFGAFLPQFLSPSNPVLPQLIMLGLTFLILATINAAMYAFFAGQMKELMKTGSSMRLFNRCGGSALIGASLLTAAMKKA